MADGGYPGRAVVRANGGGGYAGRRATPVPRSKGKKKSGGGFLHDLERYSGAEFVANAAKDVGGLAVGIGPGLYKAGKTTVVDPWKGLLTGHNTFDPKSKQQKQIGKLGKEVVQSYKDYYGHDLAHHLYTHPVQGVLDALSIFDAGAGVLAKTGKLGKLDNLERVTKTTRSPRNVIEGKGPVQETLSSTKPIVKAREAASRAAKTKASAAIAKAAPKLGLEERPAYAQEGLKPEYKQYGQTVQSEATRTALERLGSYEPYAKAWRKLSKPEEIAANIRSFDVHPDDLAELWQGTENAELLTPKVRDLILTPSKRMTAAETEARALSEKGADLLKLDDTVRDARPDLVRRQASEVLGRDLEPLHGDPYYMPHVLEPGPIKDPLRAGGGGRGAQRKLGTEKRNQGKLLLAGKLHLRGDILGPEFMRRVTKLKYEEIHDALVRGGVRMTGRELDELFNGKAPKGYEFILKKPSQRLPLGARLESAKQLLHGTLGKLSTDEKSLNARLADLDKTYEALVKKLIPEVSPYGGKASKAEQLRRNQMNAKGRVATPRTRALKAEKKALRSDPRFWENKGKARQRSAWGLKEDRRLDREIGASYDRPGGRVKSVSEEEFALAEEKLHEVLDSGQGGPAFDAIRKTIAERDAIRGYMNAKAEHDLFGEDVMGSIPDLEELSKSLYGEGFTTSDRNVAKVTGDHYHLVPSGLAKAATGEFTRSGALTRTLVTKPLSVWRAAVLGLRPGFLVNNLVGNSLMYAIKTGGQGALRDLFGVLVEMHGPQVAEKILRNPATPPGLKPVLEDFYKRNFPEQLRGTFGRTQSPSTSAAHETGRKISEGYRKVTGVIPKATSVVAEELPRRALLRNAIRKSPEFKETWRSLPKETRSFEEAAQKVLDGAGRPYQRMISKQVDDALGNYLQMSPFERNILRNTFPFYSWYRAIARVTFHLAADTPLRANILGKLGQIGTQARDDEVPDYLRGAIGIGKGPMNTERVLSTGGLNPWYTLEQLRRSGTDIGEAGINPFALAAFEAYANLRPYPGGPVSPAALAEGALGSIARNLPLSRLIMPKGPSLMYPTRGRRTETLNWLGVPLKEYDRRRALVLARQERSGR
jgi:hypothetical protein